MSHSEYKDVVLNNKSLKYSMNRIQSKTQEIEINRISLSFFEDNISILNNGYMYVMDQLLDQTMDQIYMMDQLLVIRVD